MINCCKIYDKCILDHGQNTHTHTISYPETPFREKSSGKLQMLCTATKQWSLNMSRAEDGYNQDNMHDYFLLVLNL